MSEATKRKIVAREVLEHFVALKENQLIVKVLAGRGNNLHEVESPDRQTFLVSMPAKFRKTVWIKRGDYVVIEPIEEGDKVKAEIAHVLYKDQIRHLKQQNSWPTQFDDNNGHSSPTISSVKKVANDEDESENEEDDLFVNTNRATTYEDEDSNSSSDSDEYSH